MNKTRLEAFSDGVFAILITIMVLELKVPEGADIASLKPLIPVFLSYVLSFLYLGIYWNNHHHLLHTAKHVSAGILWANLHLMFWLSLIPFVTGWMGKNGHASIPVGLYGVVLLMAALAYFILQGQILRKHGNDSLLAKAIGNDLKGKMSLALYSAAIAVSFAFHWLSQAFYVIVALMWLIPDRRIEKHFESDQNH
jgi:uncharacterized membrane protein